MKKLFFTRVFTAALFIDLFNFPNQTINTQYKDVISNKGQGIWALRGLGNSGGREIHSLRPYIVSKKKL